MLWIIFFVLLILWLVGIIMSVTFGGLIYLLLVAAIIIFFVKIFSGKTPPK